MVLRCKGISPEPQDEANSSLNLIKNKNASQEDAQKATGNKRANQMVNFILIIHGYSYVNGVELFVKQIDGIESVKGDSNSIRLEVMGQVDPCKIREMVARETKKKVELIFPSAEMKRNRDENEATEAKLKKPIKRAHKNDIANKIAEESLLTLKIKLCCEYCNQKLHKNLKNKGLDIVSMDVDNDLVTVKGMVDMRELRSYIKHELKKDVEIIDLTVDMAPVKKKGNGGEEHVDIIDKKDKDAAATNKKDIGNAAEKYKGTGKANDKIKGIAGVDEKRGGSAIVTKKHKCNSAFNEPGKDKDGGIKNRRDVGTGKEMKYKESDGFVGERSEGQDGGGNKEEAEHNYRVSDAIGSKRGGRGNKVEDLSSTIKLNSGMLYRHDNNDYGYWHEWHPVKYSNGLHQIFSDENAHSCSVI